MVRITCKDVDAAKGLAAIVPLVGALAGRLILARVRLPETEERDFHFRRGRRYLVSLPLFRVVWCRESRRFPSATRYRQ